MMEQNLVSYFEGEKYGAVVLVAVGALGIALAAVLFQPRWELRALAVTLAVVALAELALGVGLLVRTGPQVTALLAQLGTDAGRFFSEEGARMDRVQRAFVFVQYAEVTVIVLAAVVAFAQKNRFAVVGVALGLLCHAAFLLAFDLIAERRGAIYQAALQAGADPAGAMPSPAAL